MATLTYIADDNALTQGGSDVTSSGSAVGPSLPRWFATDANTRYYPLFDVNTLKISMLKSSNKGGTDLGWARMDDGNAPVSAADNSGPQPQIFQFYGSAFDPAAKVVYVVFWNAGHTLSVKPFRTSSDTWGAEIVSTLGYVGNPPTIHSGLLCGWRPNDSAVLVFAALGPSGSDTATTPPNKTWFAKCTPGGAGWDGALTIVPPGITGNITNSGTGIVYGTDWYPGGLGSDPITGEAHVTLIGKLSYLLGSPQTLLNGTVDGAGHLNGVSNLPQIDTGIPDGTWNFNVNGEANNILGRATIQIITAGWQITSVTIVSTNAQWFNVPAGFRIGAISYQPKYLAHVTLKLDNTFSAAQTVIANLGVPDGPDFVVPGAIIATPGDLDIFNGTMRTTVMVGASNSSGQGAVCNVLRAPVGYAPIWENTQPLTIFQNAIAGGRVDCIGSDGTFDYSISVIGGPTWVNTNGQLYFEAAAGTVGDYLFFGYDPGGGSFRYSFLTSVGIGSPWTAPTAIAEFSQASPSQSLLGVSATRMTAGLPPPPPAQPVSIALFFEGILRVPVKQNKNWLADRMKQLRDLLK